MPTTGLPGDIWFPDENSPMVIQDLLATQAASVNTALGKTRDELNRGNVPMVADAAKRKELFPDPKQGNRVYRVDLGYTEGYFDIKSTSNPTGKAAAGWYRLGPTVDMFGGLNGTGDGAGSPVTVPVNLEGIIKAGYVQATVGASGLISFLTFPEAFPGGVSAITLTSISGTAATPVINGRKLNRSGFQALFPGVAQGAAVSFSYIAVGW